MVLKKSRPKAALTNKELFRYKPSGGLFTRETASTWDKLWRFVLDFLVLLIIIAAAFA